MLHRVFPSPVRPSRPCLLPCIGRKDRRRLTQYLQLAWAPAARQRPLQTSVWCLRPIVPRFPCRRPRRLFEQQRRTWGQGLCARQRWSGWPSRACRIGEASHPGPPAPGTPVGGERPRRRQRSPSMELDPVGPARVYCPVQCCPCSDPARARGWADTHSMRAHIDSHLAGTLQGEVPAEWLRAQRRQRCTVCSLSVSTRHGIHPTCRPAARAAVAANAPRTDSVEDLPSFADIQAGGVRTLRHVPVAARSLWGRALSHALASIAHHNDDHAPPVRTVPAAAGWAQAPQSYTKDRLQRWLEGDRGGLWRDRCQPMRGALRQRSAEQKRELAVALAREGFDGKVCNALVAEGLCPATPETADALRELHPAQPAVHVDSRCVRMRLPALRAFPADTAPGPSGLRIQELREARQPSWSSLLLLSISLPVVRPVLLPPQYSLALPWSLSQNPKAASAL